MKKLFLIGLLGVMITSCKKEYTCECTFYWGNGTAGNTTQQTIKDTKEKATKKCAEKEEPQQGGTSNYTICHLK